jgi:hypothetical protein
MSKVKANEVMQLESYAQDNYEQGGHWVYESFDESDYMAVLESSKWDMTEAKARIKGRWELLLERERECAWGGEGEW